MVFQLSTDRLDEILSQGSGAVIGIMGLGVSGLGVAQVLSSRGLNFIGFDERDISLPSDLASHCVGMVRSDALSALGGISALFVSPGVALTHELVQEAMKRNLPVFGELEMIADCGVPCIAITGTNGKSTTTALVAALLQGVGFDARIGGNFGTPMVCVAQEPKPNTVLILELSSYQLETNTRFRPDVAVILNLTPDHLARHKTMEGYAAAKARILCAQTEHDVAILNGDDPLVLDMANETRAKIQTFSLKDVGAVREPPLPEHPQLLGEHNRQNAMAAFLAVEALLLKLHHPINMSDLHKFYLAFPGLEHRIEHVATVNGVRWINDSKATNDDAAAVGVRAVPGPLVLLLGGRDKGAGYAQVLAAGHGKLRHVIAFGEAAPLVMDACRGVCEATHVASLAAAVSAASTIAKSGDAVLLSPACSSFDEFKNFEERGHVFKSLVGAL